MNISARQFDLSSLRAMAFLTVLTACGGQQGLRSSSIQVTNGREIKETEYPSVVLLVANLDEGQGLCTGTFINAFQVLTAGHCVEGLNPRSPEMYYVAPDAKGQLGAVAKVLSFKRNPSYSIELGVNRNDLSVLTFAEGVAPAVSALTTVNPRAGDKLTIVGYGNNENFPSETEGVGGNGAGVKRAGSNQVGEVSEGMINFIGTPEKESKEAGLGDYVLSGSGDSGGPLFINGRLAGVTSGGGFATLEDGSDVAVSMYVDLTSPESRAFLTSAVAR